MDRIYQHLERLGLLPKSPSPGSKIDGAKIVGDLLFISGHGPHEADGSLPWIGRLGAEVSLEEGYQAARRCAVNCLGAAKRALGTLERIEEVIKVLGFINSDPDFHEQPKVLNGFTDLLTELYGEKGRHARSAIGTSNLPFNQPVEVEMIVKIKPD